MRCYASARLDYTTNYTDMLLVVHATKGFNSLREIAENLKDVAGQFNCNRTYIRQYGLVAFNDNG